MFAANAHLQVRPRGASLRRGHLHQLADACRVERSEWILFEDAQLYIRRQEMVDVVAADAEGGLGEVVGSEREKIGALADLASIDAGAGEARPWCRPNS